MTLSYEQQEAFDAFIEGRNVLITGPGGSGKSHLIKSIVKHSKDYGRNIQVCALTGCACVLLECGAKTVHSWGGIGLANGNIKDVVKRVTRNRHKRKSWLETDILVIDEISMMSKKIFNILDLIGRIVRNRRGRLSVVFSLFYQETSTSYLLLVMRMKKTHVRSVSRVMVGTVQLMYQWS